MEEDVSKDRMEHVLGRYEITASEFYGKYVENEESYYDLPVRAMSKLTRNILGAVDYEFVKRRREENFSYLHERLSEKNGISVNMVEGSFAYPFYVKGGMEIKKALAGKGIYVPSLWPSAMEFGGLAKDYSENILPLPCDQRYSVDEMKIIVDELEKNLCRG